MHIPAGRSYRLRWSVGEAIPQAGFPDEVVAEDFDDVLFAEIPPSPFVLSARVHSAAAAGDHEAPDSDSGDQPTGSWKLTWRHALHEMSMPVDFGDDIDWLVRELRYGPTLAGHSETETAAPGEPVVLLRVRRFKDALAGAYSIDPEPCDGLLVWLEPK